MLIKVFSELQGVIDCNIVLEVTLGTIVLEIMKVSLRITGNMSFACNEMCPVCFQLTPHHYFNKVSGSIWQLQLYTVLEPM